MTACSTGWPFLDCCSSWSLNRACKKTCPPPLPYCCKCALATIKHLCLTLVLPLSLLIISEVFLHSIESIQCWMHNHKKGYAFFFFFFFFFAIFIHHTTSTPRFRSRERSETSSKPVFLTMCVVLKIPMKYSLCTLPIDSVHIFYNARIITTRQPSMSESVAQKLSCRKAKTVQYGSDMGCHDLTEWQVPFGSTLIPGRCPRCEQDRLYSGK